MVCRHLGGRVASVTFGRVVKAVGGKLTPAAVLKLRPARMRTLGLSGQKTACIRDLARHAREGHLVFEQLAELPDDAVIGRLTQVKGVGVWTVHIFLIFALRRTGMPPTGHRGIRNAVRKAYGLDELPSPLEV